MQELLQVFHIVHDPTQVNTRETREPLPLAPEFAS